MVEKAIIKTKQMKNIIVMLTAAVALNVSAAEPLKPGWAKTGIPPNMGPAKAVEKWYSSISLAPVGAIKTEHLDGPSQWGAGVDLGYAVNPFVSIHVVNLGFEGAGCEQPWHGPAVDETDLQVDAKISRFSNETFSLHLVSGAQTDWNDNNYGINAGLRVELALNKKGTVSISSGYSIRTWLKGNTKVDSLATAQINFRF